MKLFIRFFLSCLFIFSSASATEDLRQMPAAFNHSFIGLTAGLKATRFNNNHFENDIQFKSIKDRIIALRLSIGHYFTPYIGLAASLMRGAHSNKFNGFIVNGRFYPSAYGSVSESLFGITLLPTLPLGNCVALYAETGAGFYSRHGFSFHHTPVVNDANFFDVIIGGGAIMALPYHLFLNVNAIYTPELKSKKQPSMVYVGFGFNYMLVNHHRNFSQPSTSFPLNFFQVAFANQNWFYWDVAKYFTPPYIPIFFDGHIKVGQGVSLMYERNFFHTEKYFSMEWGVSVGGWKTRRHHQQFFTLSIFPELKVWITRSPTFDFYFAYSLAGPSYISRRFFNGVDSGSKFTFQDFLGFGAFLGRSKRININLKIIHFSNGNTLPHNPGICIPVMLGVGISF
jgi:hypothetical protein